MMIKYCFYFFSQFIQIYQITSLEVDNSIYEVPLELRTQSLIYIFKDKIITWYLTKKLFVVTTRLQLLITRVETKNNIITILDTDNIMNAKKV